jgi:hypothetical protein
VYGDIVTGDDDASVEEDTAENTAPGPVDDLTPIVEVTTVEETTIAVGNEFDEQDIDIGSTNDADGEDEAEV